MAATTRDKLMRNRKAELVTIIIRWRHRYHKMRGNLDKMTHRAEMETITLNRTIEERSALDNKVMELNDDITDLKSRLTSNAEVIEGLNERINQLLREKGTLEVRYENLKSDLHDTNKWHKAAKAHVGEQQKIIEGQHIEIEKLRDQIGRNAQKLEIKAMDAREAHRQCMNWEHTAHQFRSIIATQMRGE